MFYYLILKNKEATIEVAFVYLLLKIRMCKGSRRNVEEIVFR